MCVDAYVLYTCTRTFFDRFHLGLLMSPLTGSSELVRYVLSQGIFIWSMEMRGGTDKSRYEKCKCISNEHILCKIVAVSLRPRDN